MRRWVGLLVCGAALAQTPDALRRDVEYLASDELEGRATPSAGLEKAADFIFNRFREAGLEAEFQTAHFVEARVRMQGFSLVLGDNAVDGKAVRIRSLVPLELKNEPVVVLPESGLLPLGIEGKVVAGKAGTYGREELLPELQKRKPKLILLIGPLRGEGRGAASFLEDAEAGNAPVLRIAAELPARGSTVSLHLEAPPLRPVPLRNVVGVLKGADPRLRNQYVLVTAHYDHVGRNDQGIFPGANDNASGTATVLEIAAALAAVKERPRRTVVFIAFFGEERGLLGSYYYARHPLFPLKDTVADVNFEQMGRAEGHPATFGVTGQSFTTMTEILTGAALKKGVRFRPDKEADSYFERSDNYPFALFGIPNLTAVAAFDYAEYHDRGDTADKLDFENMAKVDRALAGGIVKLANAGKVPGWQKITATAVYRAGRGR